MKKLLLLFIALVTSLGTTWAANKTVYLEPNIWDAIDATEYYAVYSWGGAQEAAFYDMEAVAGTSYFKATIPDDRTGITFTRAGSAANAKNWDNKWNQTEDITLPASSNSVAYFITSWSDGADGKSTARYSATLPNYALLGTALATSGTAANAIDGNNGTRWESASSDPQTWQVDLGTAKTFNTISIRWEGAYGKTFTIEVGDNVDGDGYLTGGTQVVNIENQTLAGFPYVQDFKFDAKTARYIKFTGTARGTGYGYSFWEFGVYNLAEDLAVTSLELTSDKTNLTVGGTANLTAVGKDQLDGIIETGALTWESSVPAVGTVADGVFTALTAGTTEITAKKGDIVSNAVTITVVAGEKIDLFTNWISRVYTLGADTKAASRDGMVDTNDGSLWELHGTTAADETSRTYETGFIVDLNGIYDITKISIHFEGACSEAFGLAFAGEDGVFGSNVYTGGKTGINNHTEEFQGESVTDARYVKFLSTKASSEWGVKIYDFSVYGIQKSVVTDTENPTVNATEAAKTDESITLTLSGTDNSSKYLTYEVAANGIAATYFFGAAGANTTATLNNLAAGTTYNFAIYSIDSKGNRSAIKELSVKTTGETFVLTAAPAPTKAAEDVMSIYSDAYTPATTYGYGGWDQSTQVGTETVDEDNMLHLTNFNYLGFEYATQLNLSGMEYLHIDILPMQAMDFGITPILVAAGSGTKTENSQSVGTLNVKEWNSIDIPMTQFADMDFTQLSHQLKIDKGTGSDVVYVDNIYFWKSPATPTKTVTFVNSGNWAHVYAYAWNGEGDVTASWHGDLLTNNGDNTYTYTTTGEPTYIIFNDGIDDGAQTGDLVFEDGATYNVQGKVGNYSITFINDENWTKVYVHAYGQKSNGDWYDINGWPGDELTDNGDGTFTWNTTLGSTAFVKFANQNGEFPGEASAFVNGATYNYIGIPAVMGYYIVGSMNGWTVGDADYKMVQNAGADHEYMKVAVPLTTTDKIKVVYTRDGVQATWYPDGANFNADGNKITADDNYTVYFNTAGDGDTDYWYQGYIYIAQEDVLADRGVDATTGAHVITGPWDGGAFGTLDAASQATSYDLTNIDANLGGGTFDTVKKNALFIRRADQNIGKNSVVDNGDGTYTGYNIEILDWNEYSGQNTEMNTKISPITGTVNYHRTVPAQNVYFTQVVPFTMAVPANITAYEATTSTSSAGVVNVTFSEVTTMQAGVPYLLTATDAGAHFLNATSLDFSAGSDANLTDCAFKATYAPVNPVPANTYVVAKGSTTAEFRLASTGSYIPAFRAYLQLNDPAAKINVLIDDATGIHSASADMLNALFNIYSIDGKVVRHNADTAVDLPKGVYIINGKKVVVK